MKLSTYIFLSLVLFTACKKNRSGYQVRMPNSIQLAFINTGIQGGLISIYFLNAKEGFVTTYNGGIYKTVDSAKTWIPLNSNTTLPIWDICFTDTNNGIAVGGMNSCGGTGCIPPGGFILKTTDGGQTWNRVFTTTDKKEITSIYFLNKNKGFCAGDDVIYKTTDGGQNWSETPIPGLGGKMMKVRFGDDKNGMIACLYDKIVKTDDGGNTWKVTTTGSGMGYYSLSWADNTVYISGQGKISKSEDFGANWNELPNSPGNIFDIYFSSRNIGYSFGSGNYSGGDFGHTYGSIYFTKDGGKTWIGNGNYKEVGTIRAASFPLDDIGYAVSGNTVIKILVK